MSRPVQWYFDKAQSLVTAYQKRYGVLPTVNATTILCAVAYHETQCGDAWNNSHNWGGIQRRSPTTEEKEVLKSGGHPTPRDSNEILMGDSSPKTGKYPVWFWAFPNDVVGADKLLQILLDNRKEIKSSIDTIDPYNMARVMYKTHYYEGFHNPDPAPGEVVPVGGFTAGQVLNILDYKNAIGRGMNDFTNALYGWKPGDPVPSPNSLEDVKTAQKALMKLGYDLPKYGADGKLGAETSDAVKKFQTDNKIILVNGELNSATLAGLSLALRRANIKVEDL